MEVRVRSALPFMLITLVLGTLFGLLLGWQIWPVTWYNTDPSDLRIEHQKAYVRMAAESFAQTGNVEQARQGLAELQDEDTSWEQVANLVDRVAKERENAGDAGGALLIRRMAQTLQMPSATAAQFQEPQYRIRFSDNPLLLPVLALALVLLVGLAAWLLLTGAGETTVVSTSPLQAARAKVTQTRTVTTTTVSSDTTPPLANRAVHRSTSSAQTLAGETGIIEDIEEPLDAQLTVPGEYIAPEAQRATIAEPQAPLVAPEALPEQEVAAPLDLNEDWEEEEEEEEIAPGAVVHPEVARSELPPDVLGIWEADYAYGDDDFDCNFTIETPDHEFLGECGVGAVDYAVGEGPQKVDAFEVWLFDKGDIRTVRQILVSDYAFNDPALNARLAEKGDVMVVQPGAIIPLETLSLVVTATVQEFAYLQDNEKGNAYFERLRVELIAEKNDQLP